VGGFYLTDNQIADVIGRKRGEAQQEKHTPKALWEYLKDRTPLKIMKKLSSVPTKKKKKSERHAACPAGNLL